MRVLLVGDIHLADRPPSIRTETYTDDILDKLRYTKYLAEKKSVDAVVWAGDVFHVKTASRTSHALVQRTADIGGTYPCPWYIVPGNHDMQNDRIESITETQPLGVLYKVGAKPLIKDIWALHDDLSLFGIPYLQDWKELPKWMEAWQRSDAKLMVTHAPIFPDGEDPPYDYIAASTWAELMVRPGDVYYGHIHDPHGTYRPVDGFTFCNQGALSRGSLHEATLRRKPAVTLWEDGKFTRIEVPHKPVEEVFRLALKEANNERYQNLDEFLESVGSTTLEQLSVEAVQEFVKGLDLSKTTRTILDDALEEALNG